MSVSPSANKSRVLLFTSIAVSCGSALAFAIQTYLAPKDQGWYNETLFAVSFISWIILIPLLAISFIAIASSKRRKGIGLLFFILILNFDISVTLMIVMEITGHIVESSGNNFALNLTGIFLFFIVATALLLLERRLTGQPNPDNMNPRRKAVLRTAFGIFIVIAIPPLIGFLAIPWGLYSGWCSNCSGDYMWQMFVYWFFWLICAIALNTLLPILVATYCRLIGLSEIADVK